MASRRLRLGALAIVFSAALAQTAAADPTASEKETARGMMDEGHARRDAGDHAGALAQFQGADAIMHVPTTGLEVGREQIALGLLVEARDTLGRVTRTAPSPNEPDAFRAARRAADALDQELAGRIPSLRITETGVPADAGVVVTVDGARIPLAALIAPIKVNPGHHVVAASAGARVAHQEIDVAEGQTAAVPLALAAPTPPPSSPAAPDTTSGGSTAAWLRWGGVGLAGVGVVLGSVTGAMSLASTSAASKGCVNDRCPPPTWGDIDSARTTGAISTVAFVAAGVGAALFVTSFAVGSPSAPATKERAAPPPARITAGIGAGSGWVGASF